MNHLNQNEMKTHVTILGWLNIGGGILLMVLGAFVFMLLTFVGIASGDSEAMPILALVGTSVCGFMLFMSVPSLLAGYGLLRRKNWGRILAIIVGALGLMNIPIGTIIGIYTFWVLFQQEAPDYFMPIKNG